MKHVLLAILILTLALTTAAQKDVQSERRNFPKLSAEEIVNKHVASIGTREALAALKSRVMVGVGVFTTRTMPGKIGGPAQLASAGDKFLFAMVLNANDYPYEKFGYDGKDLTTATLPDGAVSPLGDFLKSNRLFLKRGLLGGSLSQGWALLNPSDDIRLESGGTAKIKDKTLYKLKVSGAGLADTTVSLYFEPETFLHVRTEYSYRIGQISGPNPNRVPLLNGSAPRNYTLIEDFADFRKVDDIVLPLSYSIEYTAEAGRTLLWTINFSQVFNNQPLEPTVFRVS